MSVIAVIPARLASTRLARKLLLDETGKPLIRHTYEQAKKAASLDGVVIATDSEEIAHAAKDFCDRVIMTDPALTSGTARVAEAARLLNADIIVNIQGDEPEIDPQAIDQLVNIQVTQKPFASTLVCPFPADVKAGPGSPDDPAAVKAIIAPEKNGARRALYFTRGLAPWPRASDGAVTDPGQFYLHIGIYAFSHTSLLEFADAQEGSLEKIEGLEQLRILEMGKDILAGVVERGAPGVDTPDDYAAFVQRWRCLQQ